MTDILQNEVGPTQVLRPLPELVLLEEMLAHPVPTPPQIIKGILHQGCKMVLGGASKTNKSWCLLDLAMSVASGQSWWGHPCERSPALYINFELQPWALEERLHHLRAARPEYGNFEGNLQLWNLRGYNTDLTLLRPRLEEQLNRYEYGIIILDPIYKVLGNRDENANGEIADLMNELEALAQTTGAAIVFAHHFAKGDSTGKAAMDRMSGAGVWARDPDAIVTLTPHEEESCFTVNMSLRNVAPVPDFVLAWDFPIMKRANDLNPDALRRPQAQNKVCSDKTFLDAIITETPISFASVIALSADKLDMSRATAARYLQRSVDIGATIKANGFYWRSQHSQ